MVLLAALGGCVSTDPGGGTGGGYMSHAFSGGAPAPDGIHSGAHMGGPSVAGMQGPMGQPVAMAFPYNMAPPTGAEAAQAMLKQSVPLEMVQQAGYTMGGPPGGDIRQAQCCLPGKGGPGMGGMGLPSPILPPGLQPPGAVAAVGALTGGVGTPFAVQRTSVRFVGPAGMKITWYSPTPDGRAGFGPQYLEAPGRYNFTQAAIYRLKLSDIPDLPGVELYPTLEVVPANARTTTFLAHSAVPVSFTPADFAEVAAGNFLVKVIYLPDPQFQDLAGTGLEEIVSSRLEPGVDPIAEAHKRGNILVVVRLGNIDLEAPNTPAMDAPPPWMAQPPQGTMPGGPMVPGANPLAPHQHGMLPPGAKPGQLPSADKVVPPASGGTPSSALPAVPTGAPPALTPAPTGPVGKAAKAAPVEQVQYKEQATRPMPPTPPPFAPPVPADVVGNGR
jgi:hypothetical protein